MQTLKSLFLIEQGDSGEKYGSVIVLVSSIRGNVR